MRQGYFNPELRSPRRRWFAGRWDELTAVADAVNQPGLHVIIYGERGVGKTSLANVLRPTIWTLDNYGKADHEPERHRIIVKVNANTGDAFSTIWDRLLGEVHWRDNRPALGLIPGAKKPVSLRAAFGIEGALTVDVVRRILVQLPGVVLIVDEFDRAAKNASAEFTDLIKALSDFAVDCTVILVGVSSTVDQLVADHNSIKRALIQIFLPRMQPNALREILTNAEEPLEMKFSAKAADLIVHMSQGLPHYTHLIGLHSTRAAALKSFYRIVEPIDVFEGLKEAVKQAQQSVTESHRQAIHSSHKDALYRQVLLACALAASSSPDSAGYFSARSVVAPLSLILGKSVEIANFSNHLGEFCQEKRGRVLGKDGQPRAYRFQFNDPLLVPYSFMEAVANGLITQEQLAGMMVGALNAP